MPIPLKLIEPIPFGKLGLAVSLMALYACATDITGKCRAPVSAAETNAIIVSEFIFDTAPFPACHASTIAQTSHGFVAAWFGGTREGHPDVCIWISLCRDNKWSPVIRVADGLQPTGSRLPCWNPVLFQPRDGPLLLFYKVGQTESKWWGMMMISTDEGAHWSIPHRLPDGILGPIKNKPIQLANRTILCPSSTENDGWQVNIQRTSDLGQTWTTTPPVNDGHRLRLIQPTILDHGNGVLQILCRSDEQRIYESWSTNNGAKWSDPMPTGLPNPNSGIDALRLKDGRYLLVYNNSPSRRQPLNVAISRDGRSWKMALVIEAAEPELSYPAIIQSDDGLVHITYTWNRQRIRHVVLDPAKIR